MDAEQVVIEALRACAAEHNYPGGDLDLVMPEHAAPVVVEALRKAGMLAMDKREVVLTVGPVNATEVGAVTDGTEGTVRVTLEYEYGGESQWVQTTEPAGTRVAGAMVYEIPRSLWQAYEAASGRLDEAFSAITVAITDAS